MKLPQLASVLHEADRLREIIKRKPDLALPGLTNFLTGECMSTWGPCFLTFLFLLFAGGTPALTSMIQSLSTSVTFFNPTAGESVSLHFVQKQEAVLTIHVVDRDGYPVRKLVFQKPVKPQKYSFEWDGKDEAGKIVSDEAYSFRIDLVSGGLTETFFPANSPAGEVPVRIEYYDRRRGIVSYQLSKAARVHLQGVIALMNPRTKQPEGPVLKTIVNRAARGAGRVVEFWNGFNDDDGSIYLPDHPNFKLAVAATELPAYSVIALGNHQKSFAESALNRTGTSLFTPVSSNHQHHAGLSTLQDLSPQLDVNIVNGKRIQDRQLWLIAAPTVEISGSLHGPSSDAFSREPGRLWIFLDEKLVRDLPRPEKSFVLQLPTDKNFNGEHILTLNWVSEYGPVAVNALRFQLKSPAVTQQSPEATSRKAP